MKQNLKDISKREFTIEKSSEDPFSVSDLAMVQTGALQRIADSTEGILKRFDLLCNRLEQEISRNKRLKYRNANLYKENKLLKAKYGTVKVNI